MILHRFFIETRPEFVAMYCGLLWFLGITLWSACFKGQAQYWDAQKWKWAYADKRQDPMLFRVTLVTHICLMLLVLYLWWQH